MSRIYLAVISMISFLGLGGVAKAQPLSTAFTYQGELRNAGAPASGAYDLRFRLCDAAAGGSQVGPTLCSDNLGLTNGRFTVDLDFGGQFSGQQRFLEIDVRADTGLTCANGAGFITLAPRQPLTGAPNALFALTATSASTASTATNATQLNGQPAAFYQNAGNLASGTIPDARISGVYSGALALSNAGNSFTGSGGGLTGLNASNIASGTLADGRLAPTYTQALSLTNASNWFVGAFTGAGAGLTGLNASNINAGTLGNERLPMPLDLVGNVGGASIISATNSSANGYGLYGLSSATSGSSAYAILGESLGTFGAGVAGAALSTTGANAGVYGKTQSFEGVGVRGYNFAPAGNTVGIVGRSVNSPTGTGVVGTGNATGGWFEAYATTGTGLFGVSSAASGYGVGVRGQTGGDAGEGVVGLATAATGFTTGGRFEAASTQGTGVFGYTTASTGTAKGVYGQSLGSSGMGVLGVAAATTGATYGVFGQTASETGHAVHGFAAGGASGFGIGVYGRADATAGWAIWSAGRFGASGTKSFCIDHPADPENKYLLHYSTESPEVINFYSGNVVLDDTGEASVELPSYFARINEDPRYTLTPVGAPMPMLHVGVEIDEAALAIGAAAAPGVPVPSSSFRIVGGVPGAKVSWRVEAVRNDRWVQHRGAPVEVDKPAPEQGMYQNPEFYHQPPEKGMGYAASPGHPSPTPAQAIPETVRR